MNVYRVRVVYQAEYPDLVIIRYRKDFKFFPTVEIEVYKSYPGLNNNEDIRSVPVDKLIEFVKKYLAKVLASEEVIVEFKMET